MNLKRGDKSDDVKAWQQFLASMKYDLKADGDFGPATERATRWFQGGSEIPPTGEVDLATVLAAREKGFPGFGATGIEMPGPIPKPAPETPTQPLPAPLPTSHHAPSNRLYLISAGHSNVPPRDPGAQGNGFSEAVLTVQIRDAVAAKLRSDGYTVIEDGADGVNDPLKKAIVLARRADVAIEFHWNASANKTATGIEVLCKPNKKPLAQSLANAISKATGIKTRGGDGGWKADNSGQHHRLGFCEAGGLIVEVCFISNPDDMDRYKDNFQAVVENVATVLESV